MLTPISIYSSLVTIGFLINQATLMMMMKTHTCNSTNGTWSWLDAFTLPVIVHYLCSKPPSLLSYGVGVICLWVIKTYMHVPYEYIFYANRRAPTYWPTNHHLDDVHLQCCAATADLLIRHTYVYIRERRFDDPCFNHQQSMTLIKQYQCWEYIVKFLSSLIIRYLLWIYAIINLTNHFLDVCVLIIDAWMVKDTYHHRCTIYWKSATY